MTLKSTSGEDERNLLVKPIIANRESKPLSLTTSASSVNISDACDIAASSVTSSGSNIHESYRWFDSAASRLWKWLVSGKSTFYKWFLTVLSRFPRFNPVADQTMSSINEDTDTCASPATPQYHPSEVTSAASQSSQPTMIQPRLINLTNLELVLVLQKCWRRDRISPSLRR